MSDPQDDCLLLNIKPHGPRAGDMEPKPEPERQGDVPGIYAQGQVGPNRMEIERLKAKFEELTDDSYHLFNLLAIIHGDGGDYTGKHGTKKAIDDAVGVACDLRGQLEAVKLDYYHLVELHKEHDRQRNAELATLRANVEKQDRELGPLREFHGCYLARNEEWNIRPITTGKYAKGAWLAAKPKGEKS